ncbi:MAG: hypothetical protein IJA60_04615 [Clostridia bacterium]|nr:hypothetical protein [Clostridia bacterium]
MRNFKRFLSLMLAVLMVFSMTVLTTGAKEDAADYTDAAHHLAAIGILKGDENGNLMLDKHVTRYQAALFFVQAITGKTDPEVWNADKSAIFSDVPEYGTAIDYLAGLGLIVGRGGGIYGYHDNITYQDMLTLAVRTLGYERDDTKYPYGHILEAQKLGLTDNIDNVNYKAYLTRGETAQLIWDMLGTEIAMTDPLTGDIIYPGKEDESAYGLIVGPGKIQRETYLEKSGFADGKLVVTVTEFTEAEKEDEIDTVTVEYGGASHILAASDLGITATTPKVDYLGLPQTLYVDCKAEEFFDKYDTDADESDASVVFVNTEALTFVENLGDGGTIRVNKPKSGTASVTLGGVKFAADKYNTVLYKFGENGWQSASAAEFEANFLYDSKDGYIGNNSNGAVRYIVRETEENGETVKTLHIYYMPYEFGQYFVRTLKDATTSKNADFVTVGKYEATKVENKDGDKSNFVEYLLGTTSKVTSSTASVSKRNGEKAKSVVLAGEDVQSGDFVFYYYNAVDNIFTVAENHGGFGTGALTATSAANETVKIGGTQYGFGFKGAYATDYSTYAKNATAIKSIIEKYENGKDNARFVTVDGNIVFIESYEGESSTADYGFALVTLDSEIISDLLGIKQEKLEYTADFVLDENGNVTVAVLNTETGKWEIASLDKFHMDYNASEDEYDIVGDLGEYAKYVDLVGETYSKYADYQKLSAALLGANVFAVVEEKGGAISLGTTAGAVQSADIAEGIIFSDNTSKTNKIKSDPDESVLPTRVTLNDESIIVVIDGDGNVGVRQGAQKSKFTVTGNATFYAATSDLIVAYIAEPEFLGGFENAADWGESRAAATNETYYVALSTSTVEVEASGEDVEEKYTVTVTDLLDLRTLTVVETSRFNTDELISLDLTKPLYADENGVITESDLSIAEAFKAARALEGEENDITYVDIAPENLTFTDGDTVIVSGGALTLPNALAGINAHVVTIDATGIDRDDYDFDRAAVNVEYDAENGFGGNELEISPDFFGYEYPLYGDLVENIGEPTEGVFDQFIINSVGSEILVPLADADDYTDAKSITSELKILASYDEDTGILTMYVARILK